MVGNPEIEGSLRAVAFSISGLPVNRPIGVRSDRVAYCLGWGAGRDMCSCSISHSSPCLPSTAV